MTFMLASLLRSLRLLLLLLYCGEYSCTGLQKLSILANMYSMSVPPSAESHALLARIARELQTRLPLGRESNANEIAPRDVALVLEAFTMLVKRINAAKAFASAPEHQNVDTSPGAPGTTSTHPITVQCTSLELSSVKFFQE